MSKLINVLIYFICIELLNKFIMIVNFYFKIAIKFSE